MSIRGNSTNPKVSVIVPVWNPGDGIRRCVGSLRNQTLRDIDLIFVDDCGSDGAMDVVRAAAAEDPRIRIITNAENMGAGLSRNAGIEVAKGEYISFVDADDYVNPCFLEKLYSKAATYNLDIVKGKHIYKCEDGSVADLPERNAVIRTGLNEGKPLFYLFNYQHQNAIYRRSLLEKYGIRYGTSRRAQDTTFLLKVCHRAKSFDMEDSAEYHFCERRDSLMHDMHPHTLERLLYSFSEKMDYIVDNMLGEKAVTDYVARKVIYKLSVVVYYRKKTACEDMAISFIHGVRKQILRFPAADVERIKDENFTIKVLCDHEVALAQTPFKLYWEKCKAEDYVDTVSEWVDFLVRHPDCVREAEKDVKRLVLVANDFCNMEDASDNIEELHKARKALSQQMIRLSKCGFTWDFSKMLNYAKHNLNTCNQLMANGQAEEAQRILANLGSLLRLSPEIQLWAESSREVDVRGVYDYGVVLRPRLWGEYRTVPEYSQMLTNWRVFLKEHPECDVLYITGYKNFLTDACAFVAEQERDGMFHEELEELKKALKDGWRGLPFRVQLRKLWNDLKGIPQRLKKKMSNTP